MFLTQCLWAGLLVMLSSVLAEDQSAGNVCLEQKTCGSCIIAGPHCGWCLQENYDSDNLGRCDLLPNLVRNQCDVNFIERPEHVAQYTENKPPMNANEDEEAIQLSPQKMKVQIRPNKPFNFDLTFRQAENYPVDIYFVMDLSFSMEDDKKNLARLGLALAKRMSEITENFRLGFGSFVDKKTMPYVSTVPERINNPCTGCAAPYGFKNQLSLTVDTAQFEAEVERAPISGNLDSPEGGFDALMQAIACKDEIGWRDSSKKLLLYATDAGFHTAGDGKLGGIIDPNDGACHLDKQGMYSESLNQDYPSISQLQHKIAEKKMNIIFAVTADQIGMYGNLSKFIEGSVAGVLANDSSNIVDLVRENYDKISGTVEMKTVADEDIKVTFKSKCDGDELREVAKCENVGIGNNVSFEVSVQVTKCPQDKDQWKKSLQIYPVGSTEKLILDMELICECDCEEADLGEANSPKCNHTGTYECGACTCDEGRYGKNCECDGSDLTSDDYDAACRMGNDTAVCSGKGQCICGQCECYQIISQLPTTFSGKFCQCNNLNCQYHNGIPCGGPGHGVCKCGECICEDGYVGMSCDCPISEEPCMAKSPKPGEVPLVCNGKGHCHCGSCVCDLDNSFRGPTCEDCPTCPGKCEQNKACVQCTAFQSGDLSKEYCDANCTHVEMVDFVKEQKDLNKLCKFRDDDNCDFYFTYEYDKQRVEAQRTKECPQPVNVLAIILGVIGGIILIGLILLLIWKLLVTIHDQREYAKFEKERQQAKWDMGENPIYKQATSTFKNPTYTSKS